MKKLGLIVLACAIGSALHAIKVTNFGTNTADGKEIASETITVNNQTGRPVYVAVYVEKSNDKDAQLFGDIYRVNIDNKQRLLRPKWNALERAISGDRKLYFTFKEGELTSSLVPAAVPRKEKQFIKVGNKEGTEFVIFAIDENNSPNVMGQKPKAAKEEDWKSIEKEY